MLGMCVFTIVLYLFYEMLFCILFDILKKE